MKNYKLNNVFPKKVITETLEATDPEGVIRELVSLLVSAGSISDSVVDDLTKSLLAREKEGSTGIGGGVAIPHIKTDLLDDARRIGYGRDAGRTHQRVDLFLQE